MKLIIEDDEGRKTVIPLVQEEMDITIGRQPGNTIRLTERNVSRRHAKLSRRKTAVIVEDLGSYAGVRINGERIEAPYELQQGDIFQIGDYDLAIQYEAADLQPAVSTAAPAPAPQPLPDTALEDAPALSLQSSAQRCSTSIINVEQVQDIIPKQIIDIPIEAAPRLVVLNGDLKGREFACIRSVLSVGRDFDNDIAIDHRSLSRHHCKFIRTESGEWKVVDLDSSNGIQVNDEPYAVGNLASGDVVTIGHIKVQFSVAGADRKRGAQTQVGAAPTAKSSVGLAAAIIGGVVLLGGGAAFWILNAEEVPSSPAAAVVVAATEPALPDPTPEPLPSAEPQPPQPPVQAKAAPEPEPVPGPDPKALAALEDGKKALESGMYARAVELLEAAVAANLEAAEALLERALGEQDAEVNLADAQKLFDEKNLEEARMRLEAIPAKSASFAKAEALKAKIEAADAKVKKALARKKAAAKREKPAYELLPEKDAATLQRYLGEMCDQPDKAIPLLKKLIQQNSGYADAYASLGSCYASTGKIDLAVDFYQEFVHRWPTHPQAASVKGILDSYFESNPGVRRKY